MGTLDTEINQLPAADPELTDYVPYSKGDLKTNKTNWQKIKDMMGIAPVSSPVFFNVKILAATPVDDAAPVLFDIFPLYSTLPTFDSQGKVLIAEEGKYRINVGVYYTDGFKPQIAIMKDNDDADGLTLEQGAALANKLETIARLELGARLYVQSSGGSGKTYQAGDFVENCYMIVEKIGAY